MDETVAHYIQLLDHLAPPRLAESWDNVGLQVGSSNWPVHKIGIALDPLPTVVKEACKNKMELLITHHPLFFKPVKRILGDTQQGRIIEMALTHKMAIYCAHTNLDSVSGGVNDALAGTIGLDHLRALKGSGEAELCKLAVFVPSDHVTAMLDTILSLGVGRTGRYSGCTFRSEGVGTFWPDDDASPAVGKKGALNEVRESRLEVAVPRSRLDRVVNAMKKVHPYETMAFDIYPVSGDETKAGLGRVGELATPLTLSDFSNRLKDVLNLSTVKVVGKMDAPVETVAVCSGSGSSLLPAAVASGAQVYVSGDLGYHTARDAQQAGIGLIDIGHFASEHLIVDVLVKSLGEAISESGFTACVDAVGKETDPFHYL